MHTSKRESESATAIREAPAALLIDEKIENPWDFFERIYCISLTHRGDRRWEARRQFASVGLLGRVEFHIVKKHSTDCEQGIYESHLACLACGLRAGARHILVFEDDVVFDNYSPQVLAEGLAGLDQLGEWQVCFLGCMVKWSRRTANHALRRIGYRSLAHAYAVNRPFAELLVQNYPWRGVAYDDLLRNFKSTNMYEIYPACAFQSDSSTDNDIYLPLDRFRRFCGGLKKLQKINELFHRFLLWVVCGHLLILCGLVWCLW